MNLTPNSPQGGQREWTSNRRLPTPRSHDLRHREAPQSRNTQFPARYWLRGIMCSGRGRGLVRGRGCQGDRRRRRGVAGRPCRGGARFAQGLVGPHARGPWGCGRSTPVRVGVRVRRAALAVCWVRSRCDGPAAWREQRFWSARTGLGASLEVPYGRWVSPSCGWFGMK